MSLGDNQGIVLFPNQFIIECIETYTKNHGKPPKILVASVEDITDWKLSCSIQGASSLGVKIVPGKYLKSGQFDLAQGIKNKVTK